MVVNDACRLFNDGTNPYSTTLPKYCSDIEFRYFRPTKILCVLISDSVASNAFIALYCINWNARDCIITLGYDCAPSVVVVAIWDRLTASTRVGINSWNLSGRSSRHILERSDAALCCNWRSCSSSNCSAVISLTFVMKLMPISLLLFVCRPPAMIKFTINIRTNCLTCSLKYFFFWSFVSARQRPRSFQRRDIAALSESIAARRNVLAAFSSTGDDGDVAPINERRQFTYSSTWSFSKASRVSWAWRIDWGCGVEEVMHWSDACTWECSGWLFMVDISVFCGS